ncbi:oxidoreductase-like protein [Xylariomycetidae sp. FL0641]|nr:oxidoreductase-like protein [Xylariomycetidae sp. FL0641]
MPLNARPLLRAARLQPLARSPRVPRAFYSSGGPLPGGTPGEASEQAVPLGPYYETILIKPPPVPDPKPEEPPSSSPKSPAAKKEKQDKPAAAAADGAKSASASASASSAVPSTEEAPRPATAAQPSSAQEKARIVFGSRLAGPIQRAERLAELRKRGTRIAGVEVPARPTEPDNCCMSGCVNCVWEQYRDDMEEWVAASARAEAALQAQRAQGPVDALRGVSAVKGKPAVSGPVDGTGAVSMDDDGGMSERHFREDLKRADRPKIAKDLWDDDLYKNIPVGIREFMKQEKRLKQKHQRQGTFGA